MLDDLGHAAHLFNDLRMFGGPSERIRSNPSWSTGNCTVPLAAEKASFSRMRSKGSRFTLGVWGLRVCSLDVAQPLRNRSQPSATVRNRPREARMAVPMASSAKRVTFGGFQRCIASFRVAGV